MTHILARSLVHITGLALFWSCANDRGIVIPDAQKPSSASASASESAASSVSDNEDQSAKASDSEPVVSEVETETIPSTQTPLTIASSSEAQETASPSLPLPLPPPPSPLPLPSPSPSAPAPVSQSQTAFAPVRDGWYQIRGVQSSRCLDFADGQGGDGSQLQIKDCITSNATTKFYLQFQPDGFYTIKNSNGRFLEGSDNDSPADGDTLRVNPASGATRQQFQLIPGGGQTFKIKVRDTNLLIDVAGSYTAAGSWIQIALPNDSSNQLWSFLPAP